MTCQLPENVAELAELAKTDPAPAGPASQVRNFGGRRK